uniref:Uncharacterized protein n=1 Tax=Papio anubis TaxID=9555 RepID=A0A8I5N2W6_PAPAN
HRQRGWRWRQREILFQRSRREDINSPWSNRKYSEAREVEFPIIFSWVPLSLFTCPGCSPSGSLLCVEPRTLLAVPDVGVRVFPKQRNEHTRQHKTRQTWQPPRMVYSALFYTVVCGMLPSHKTHCCFSDLSLTFWIFKMFTHKQAPNALLPLQEQDLSGTPCFVC